MDNGFDERFDKIEMKLAFLEDFLNRLHEEVLQRNALMDRLGAEHGALKEKVFQLSREIEEIPDRKPPHY
ncbi:SlyX family protein [Breznakiella homolactica]|uniref:SlyX family protein n=1 Tax=Breznakiella homolactica TaxID=2798577 RepID=A0A7T8BAR7_9SPIR|nr:SlyX family protein [Breznakiella homolactica]QQO09767.1 SlyX family protein [Breznakiella homolactica]